ncbi:hypothetical protein MMC14_003217 [Varicellaria rhodocarpa]|nr:hypothetical protein [Varicellaria rhodocarpa]
MASTNSQGISFSGQEPSSDAGSTSQPHNTVGSISSSSDKDAIANQSSGTSLTPQTQAQAQDTSSQRSTTSTKRAIWSVYDINKPIPALPTEEEFDATTVEAEEYFCAGNHSGRYETDRGDESLSRYYVEKGNRRVSRVVQKKGDGKGWLRF